MPKNNYIWFFILLLFCSSRNEGTIPKVKEKFIYPHKSSIDSIESTKDLEKFITRLNPINLGNIEVSNLETVLKHRFKQIPDSVVISPFFKADFDHNGLTDIWINSIEDDYNRLYCIMDMGKRFETFRFFKSGLYSGLASVKNSNEYPQIQLFYYGGKWVEGPNKESKFKFGRLRKDNLIYKYGNFIEKEANKNKSNIERIELKAVKLETNQYFKMTINKNKTAIFETNQKRLGNKWIRGIFHSTINENEFNEIMDLLHYINIENISNSYDSDVDGSLNATYYLNIKFENGITKKIEDHWREGTFGLTRLYQFLFNLEYNQNWE